VIYALQKIGTPPAVEALRDALQLPDERVRVHAAAVLVVFGDDSQREFLATALEQAQSGPGSDIINWLREALEQRNLTGSQPEGFDRQAWVKWLREKQ